MTNTANRSPRISHIAWGSMEIEGVGAGRDFKLWPGGGRAWDWTETNMHHTPGIQPADVEELLAHGSKIVVLSRGMDLRLQTCPETIEFLEGRAVKYHIQDTAAAAATYNRLAEEGEPVGGLFHSTC
ncbi:MAG: Mth938-like domain-containing protein [Planctomycetota bacterium]